MLQLRTLRVRKEERKSTSKRENLEEGSRHKEPRLVSHVFPESFEGNIEGLAYGRLLVQGVKVDAEPNHTDRVKGVPADQKVRRFLGEFEGSEAMERLGGGQSEKVSGRHR